MGSVLPMLIGVLSIPVLMNRLGVELFGALTLIWALVGYFSLFDFGLGRALTQCVSKYQGEEDKVNIYSSIGLVLTLALGCVGAVVVFLLAGHLPGWLGVGSDYYIDVRNSLIVAAVGIPFTTLTTGCRGVLEGFFRFKDSNVLKIFLGIGNFLFPLAAVMMEEVSLTNVTISLVLARLMVLLLSCYVLFKLIVLRLGCVKEGKAVLTDLTRFGSWMTLSNIISPLMVTSDRFFISAFAGMTAVAYYTVPFEIVIRALVLPAALSGAYFAYAAKIINDDFSSAQKFYKEKLKHTVLMMLVISSALAFGSKIFLSIWIDEQFAAQAWLVMAILALGIFFNGVAQMPHSSIHASGETKSVAIAHLTEFIIYVPVLIGLIIKYGAIGAAIAWVARSFVDCLIMICLKKKIDKSLYERRT